MVQNHEQKSCLQLPKLLCQTKQLTLTAPIQAGLATTFLSSLILSNYGVYLLWKGPNFSLISCRVYDTSGFLGDVYECRRQVEPIVGPFGTSTARGKLANSL